ncbi:MAG: hypothetical protein LKE81_06180 [Acetobacter sp.]|jgi:hypothetical protein|nr:hypothetical protein [Acetobacter sp.]
MRDQTGGSPRNARGLCHPSPFGSLRFHLKTFPPIEGVGGICCENTQLNGKAPYSSFLRLHPQDDRTYALSLKGSINIEFANEEVIGVPHFGDAADRNAVALN